MPWSCCPSWVSQLHSFPLHPHTPSLYHSHTKQWWHLPQCWSPGTLPALMESLLTSLRDSLAWEVCLKHRVLGSSPGPPNQTPVGETIYLCL